MDETTTTVGASVGWSQVGFGYLHVFPFSARPGTPAARMPQLEKAVIKARAAGLRDKGQARLDRNNFV